MEKVIKIGKKEVRLDNSAAWPMEYREQFNKDIVPAIMPVIVSMVEGVSAIVSESGKTEITIPDVADAIQGRATDILLPMFQVEFVDVIINVTWAMAKAADESIAPPKQWVKQFDTFPLDVVGPAVYDMILKGFVSSKNLKRLKDLGKTIKNLQPLHSTTSSLPDSSEG